MTEPVIVRQESFDTACSVDEGWQRFEQKFVKLFTDLACYILKKEIGPNAGFPLRIDVNVDKDILDYCITAKVYSDYARSEQKEPPVKAVKAGKVSRFYRTYEPLSMIPAGGWQSVYAEYHEDDRRYARVEPLVAFALTETCLICVYENGDEEITVKNMSILGYVAGPVNIYPAREATNFIGYIASDVEIPNHMRQEARKYIEDQWG